MYIGIAAYNLYIAVDKFLETPAGKKFKKKAIKHGKPLVDKAKEVVENAVEKAKNTQN